MSKYSGPLFLGIDYGTTKVKASLVTKDDIVLNTYTISWNEAAANKFFLSDWLKVLKKVVNEVFKQPEMDPQLLSSIAITTISPCIVLIDPHSKYSSSPIILYDEMLSLDNRESRIQRLNTSIKILNEFTPNSSNKKNIILTANSWLVWQLTGELVIDNYSLDDVLGDAEKDAIIGAQFPERILSPSAIAGTIKRRWAKILDLPLNIKVCCGSTDTVSLVRATKLKSNEHLIYLGTFFTILEAKADFSNKIPTYFTPPPYKWHISLEGGALIERLSSSYFPLEENRSEQLSKYLEVVRKNLNVDEEQIKKIMKKEWSLGIPVQMLPVLSNSGHIDNSLPNLAIIPFISFAQALKTYFNNNQNIGLVHVAGGLSSNKWLTKFLMGYLNIPYSSKKNVIGAEGAALLAKDSFYVH